MWPIEKRVNLFLLFPPSSQSMVQSLLLLHQDCGFQLNLVLEFCRKDDEFCVYVVCVWERERTDLEQIFWREKSLLVKCERPIHPKGCVGIRQAVEASPLLDERERVPERFDLRNCFSWLDFGNARLQIPQLKADFCLWVVLFFGQKKCWGTNKSKSFLVLSIVLSCLSWAPTNPRTHPPTPLFKLW